MALMIYTFFLEGASCINCLTPIVEKLNEKFKGDIISAKADSIDKTITVILKNPSITPEQLIPVMTSATITPLLRSTTSPKIKKTWNHKLQAIIGLTVGAALLVFSLFMGAMPWALMASVVGISTVLTLILGAPSYYHACVDLIKHRRCTMDTLFAISTLTVVITSIAALFVPWLPMMCETALLIFGFRHAGLAIKEHLLSSFHLAPAHRNMLPKTVVRKRGDGIQQEKRETCDLAAVPINDSLIIAQDGIIPMNGVSLTEERRDGIQRDTCNLADVAIGDILIIPQDGIIPMNGVSLTDDCLINTELQTGATEPVILPRGREVLAGMRVPVNKGNPKFEFEFVVTKSLKDSYLFEFEKAIAQAKTTPIMALTEKLAQYFTPTVLVIALITGIVVGCFFPPALAIQCVAMLLGSACPCLFGLIAPLVFRIAHEVGKQRGAYFMTDEALERTAQVDTMMMDVNGTLTEGKPVVVEMEPDHDNEMLLNIAVHLEEGEDHTAAESIRTYARLKLGDNVSNMAFLKKQESKHSSGVMAIVAEETIGFVKGSTWYLGDPNYMSYHNVSPRKKLSRSNQTPHYLSCGSDVKAVFYREDRLRFDAAKTLAKLRQDGFQLYLNTGADEATAFAIGDALKIEREHIFYSQRAFNKGGKVEKIENLRQRGLKVAMVGNGRNDEAALAASDLAILIDSPQYHLTTAQLAQLRVQHLSIIPDAIMIAQHTLSHTKRMLAFSILYNVGILCLTIGLLVGCGIVLHPAIGAALMILQTLLVLGGTYLFKQRLLESPKPVPHFTTPLSASANADPKQQALEIQNPIPI